MAPECRTWGPFPIWRPSAADHARLGCVGLGTGGRDASCWRPANHLFCANPHLMGPGQRDRGGWSRVTWLACCEPPCCVPTPIFWDLGSEIGEVGPESRGVRPLQLPPRRGRHQGPACPLALQHLTQRIRHGDVGERRPARTSVPRVGSAPLHSMTALSDTPRAVTTVGSGRPSRIAVLLLQWERTKDRRSFVSSGIIPAQVNLLGA